MPTHDPLPPAQPRAAQNPDPLASPPAAEPAAALPPAALPPAALPPAWINAHDQHSTLWPRLARASHSLLICDYDGTLAPFKADKMQARPYPGVPGRLERIAALPHATLALVSGRPVAELITVFPLAAQLELYGSHGREHRTREGVYHLEEISLSVREALDGAAAEIADAGWAATLERKAASLAIHWRNLSPSEQADLAKTARSILDRHTAGGALSTLPFESGMELRAHDFTKAHAVEQLLQNLPNFPADQPPIAAFLGDDTTDEDAFRALGSHGLSLLVREEPRPSLANYWIRPPAQLLGFLDDWLRAATRGI